MRPKTVVWADDTATQVCPTCGVVASGSYASICAPPGVSWGGRLKSEPDIRLDPCSHRVEMTWVGESMHVTAMPEEPPT